MSQGTLLFCLLLLAIWAPLLLFSSGAPTYQTPGIVGARVNASFGVVTSYGHYQGALTCYICSAVLWVMCCHLNCYVHSWSRLQAEWHTMFNDHAYQQQSCDVLPLQSHMPLSRRKALTAGFALQFCANACRCHVFPSV